MELNLPKLIGHRGVKDLAPENTIASINKAIDFNLEWVEIDVKISKDRIPFLLHDDKLDRTTSGKGKPFNLKYENIKKLDAGQWFNKRYKNSYPPTLYEVLELCFKKKIGINIEAKTEQVAEENVVKVIEEKSVKASVAENKVQEVQKVATKKEELKKESLKKKK